MTTKIEIITQLQTEQDELLAASKFAYMEQRAFMFACEKHGDQKYGEQPYFHHLFQVRELINLHFRNEPAQVRGTLLCGAWLHDCLEDTPTSFDEVRDCFSLALARIVEAVSGFGANRKERNRCIYDAIGDLSNDEGWLFAAASLKVADRLANMRSCQSSNDQSRLQMYLKEVEDFEHYIGQYAQIEINAELRSLVMEYEK